MCCLRKISVIIIKPRTAYIFKDMLDVQGGKGGSPNRTVTDKGEEGGKII